MDERRSISLCANFMYAGDIDHLQRHSSVCNLRPGGDTAEVALQLDGAVVRVGVDPGDQATQRRDRFLDALPHAVGRPGDDGV